MDFTAGENRKSRFWHLIGAASPYCADQTDVLFVIQSQFTTNRPQRGMLNTIDTYKLGLTDGKTAVKGFE